MPPAAPGLMSRTRRVPAAVPSVAHSSRPSMPVVAANSMVLPRFAKGLGELEPKPRFTSSSRLAGPLGPLARCNSLPPEPPAAK